MSYFNKNRFLLRQVVIMLAIACLGVARNSYAQVVVPNTFHQGTTISSAEVNQNFSALASAITGTGRFDRAKLYNVICPIPSGADSVHTCQCADPCNDIVIVGGGYCQTHVSGIVAPMAIGTSFPSNVGCGSAYNAWEFQCFAYDSIVNYNATITIECLRP
jgi:hypothetical protein